MTKRKRLLSFRQQMKQSLADLQSIVDGGESFSGNGRFTVRTIEVAQPSLYSAKSIRSTRKMLNVSQAIFADLLGVSAALVRAWELGTRTPAPIARRLLDQMRAEPRKFADLVRPSESHPSIRRPRKVA